jgi:hypothetical protein
MGAVYDKYEPLAGGFRAPLAATLPVDGNGESGVKAMSLDANGRAVVGTGGQSGLIGVTVKNIQVLPGSIATAGMVLSHLWVGNRPGDVVDIMTNGEIVDLDKTAFPAGSKVYAHADGTVDTVATAGTRIGHTVEAGRLVVRYHATA